MHERGERGGFAWWFVSKISEEYLCGVEMICKIYDVDNLYFL